MLYLFFRCIPWQLINIWLPESSAPEERQQSCSSLVIIKQSINEYLFNMHRSNRAVLVLQQK